MTGTVPGALRFLEADGGELACIWDGGLGWGATAMNTSESVASKLPLRPATNILHQLPSPQQLYCLPFYPAALQYVLHSSISLPALCSLK